MRRAPENLRPDLQDKMLDLMPALSAQDMAALDLKGFAQKAIMARDVETLRGLYGALEGDARQARIALAADALGNGFNFGPLGKDIDSRLSGENSQSQAGKIRAQRDAMLALAMGAQISDAARTALKGQALTTGRSLSAGDKAIMRAAVKSGAQAELVLLSAQHLEGPRLDTQSLAALVEYLNSAGLPQFAGRIAAQDFIADL